MDNFPDPNNCDYTPPHEILRTLADALENGKARMHRISIGKHDGVQTMVQIECILDEPGKE